MVWQAVRALWCRLGLDTETLRAEAVKRLKGEAENEGATQKKVAVRGERGDGALLLRWTWTSLCSGAVLACGLL